ncbi:MAG: hypothetical protein O2904_00460 [bacterium]|nr:hypothetical protein [bacterium]
MILALLIASATCYGPSDCVAPMVCSSGKRGSIPGVCRMTKETHPTGADSIKPIPVVNPSTSTPPVPAPPAAAPAFSPPLAPPAPPAEFEIPDAPKPPRFEDSSSSDDDDASSSASSESDDDNDEEVNQGPVAKVVNTIIVTPATLIIESVKDFWCLLFGCN